MFWTDVSGGVRRVKLDGSEAVTIVDIYGYDSKCLLNYVRLIAYPIRWPGCGLDW